MVTNNDLNHRKLIESGESQDSFSKVKFSLNCQSLKADYDRDGLLIHRFSFGTIALQILKTIHLGHFVRDLATENRIRHSVDYIANELLENSIKYSDSTASTINLEIDVTKEHITIVSTTLINKSRCDVFLDYVQKLTNSDPSELYIDQLEKSLDDNCKSGLGLLSIIHDYKAKVSWKFSPIGHRPRILSYVIAKLPIESI